ncbi:MAG: hypothetical protein MRK01_15960 [Candidatus Scalindua sp.]|nr:hypothetical protein [Candidatus Scalindua sp.]
MNLTQLLKDVIKRKSIDIARRSERLMTPMDMAILTLQAYNHFPSTLIALEVFGMHGLWLTSDYAHLCNYLELWEVNPKYAKYAGKFLPNANVKVGDSINAIKTSQLLRNDYNFIVIDNPISGFYGSKKYCEHFDIFPSLIDSVAGKAVIIMNLVIDMEGVIKRYPVPLNDWLVRRKEFYSLRNDNDVKKLEINNAINIYRDKFIGWKVTVEETFFIPRNKIVGFLVLVINKDKVKDEDSNFS